MNGRQSRSDLIPGALSECGVGIFTWAQALVYSDQLRDAPKSWADFWNVHNSIGESLRDKLDKSDLFVRPERTIAPASAV